MELLTIFTGAFVLALSGALMPGPLFTITVADAARRGMITGPLLIAGHAILEAVLVIGVVFGLGKFLKQAPVMAVISALGGTILLWMGFSMVRAAATASLDTEPKTTVQRLHPVLLGILGSISNPYWTLWWATVGLGYLLSAIKFGWNGVLFFFIGHISADFIWYCIIAWSVSHGKKVIGPKAYQWAIRICGAFLFGFGVWFLLAAFSYLEKR